MKSSIKDKVLLIVATLFGIFFINSGLNKLFHYMPVPKDLPEKMLKAFSAFMEIGWLMPLIALAEIIGGLLIIIPRTRALGALIIFPVMVGIFLTGIVQDKSSLPIAVIFGAVLTWIIYENKQKFLPLISKN